MPQERPRRPPGLKQRCLATIAGLAGPSMLVLLVRSCRTTVAGGEHLAGLLTTGRPFLFVLWHGRMLAPIVAHRRQGIAAMVSLHSDGDAAAQVLTGLGYRTVRGSSTHGGKEAFHGMVAWLRAGGLGAVIPDGPRGPARQAKPGVVRIASSAGGLPLLPVSFAAHPARRFASWDGFMLPHPRARLSVVYGEPLEVPAGLDAEAVERYRAELERRLDAVETRADALTAGSSEPEEVRPGLV